MKHRSGGRSRPLAYQAMIRLHMLNYQYARKMRYKPFGMLMLKCDLCGQPKPDVQQWPLLRVVDKYGKRTADPFDGMLCGDCHEQAQKFGSPEHLWVLKQISQMPRRRRTQQY